MSKFLKDLKALVLGSGCARVPVVLHWAQKNRDCGRRRFASMLLRWLERNHGVYIGINAKVSETTRFPHPVGIVIGDGVEIEENCTLYQSVTLGGAHIGDAQSRSYPRIGRGSTLFAGATVIGSAVVGENCIVGANAVVLEDVPANHVAVGVPARTFLRRDYE